MFRPQFLAIFRELVVFFMYAAYLSTYFVAIYVYNKSYNSN